MPYTQIGCKFKLSLSARTSEVLGSINTNKEWCWKRQRVRGPMKSRKGIYGRGEKWERRGDRARHRAIELTPQRTATINTQHYSKRALWSPGFFSPVKPGWKIPHAGFHWWNRLRAATRTSEQNGKACKQDTYRPSQHTHQYKRSHKLKTVSLLPVTILRLRPA